MAQLVQCDHCGKKLIPEKDSWHRVTVLRAQNLPEVLREYDLCLECQVKHHQFIRNVNTCPFCSPKAPRA